MTGKAHLAEFLPSLIDIGLVNETGEYVLVTEPLGQPIDSKQTTQNALTIVSQILAHLKVLAVEQLVHLDLSIANIILVDGLVQLMDLQTHLISSSGDSHRHVPKLETIDRQNGKVGDTSSESWLWTDAGTLCEHLRRA